MEENITNTAKPIMVHIDNYTGNGPIRIIYREDKPIEKPNPVDIRLPEPINIFGIISAPADWLEKRHRTFEHLNARVDVEREEGTICLVINETNFSIHNCRQDPVHRHLPPS